MSNGTAESMAVDLSPAPAPLPSRPPTAADDGTVDINATLTQLWRFAHQQATRAKATDDSNNAGLITDSKQYEKKIARAQKWGGWVWGLLTMVGIIFSGGVAWAVFMGANATDSEVEAMVQAAADEHAGIPAHADAQKLHKDLDNRIKGIQGDVTTISNSQRKLDKRSEYQFELGRWQSAVMEAERQRKKRPGKPTRLEDLETELMLGKYGP